MSLREDLLRAGVPPEPLPDGALGVDRVERNITTAQSSRMNVRVDGDTVVFESITGERRRVEVKIARLWDPRQGTPLGSQDLRRKLAQPDAPSAKGASDAEVAEAAALGTQVGPHLDALAAIMLVESIKGFGPQKFKELHSAGVSPREAIDRPDELPLGGKRGVQFREALAALTKSDAERSRRRAARQIVRAHEHSARLITFGDRLYPKSLWESNYPIPILYARGATSVLSEDRAIACVGSRKIRPPFSELHRQFAEIAAREGFTIVSGFALGADTIGHHAALEAGGRTVAVMPSGLDRPFPPENRPLWDALLDNERAAFVSEVPFGTAASALTLRRRNKLIVALARGVMVSQSSVTGGAMNAYRFALEQRKPVATFASDRSPDTSGNNFIVEEAARRQTSPVASLPDHPDQERWRGWLRELSSST